MERWLRIAAMASAVLIAPGVVAAQGGAGTTAGAAPGPQLAFAAHRAVYDLSLAEKSGNRPLEAVRGRIALEFTGSVCEGYALNFRQVTEMTAEDKSNVTDLRSTTFEDAHSRVFRFMSQSFTNTVAETSVEGRAERRGDRVEVAMGKPSGEITIDRPVLFPVEHMRAIIGAAKEGRTLLEASVYDGSDDGRKVYRSLAVIGRPIKGGSDALEPPARQDLLRDTTRWRVTISYFHQVGTGEQTPIYAIAFDLYENGVSRDLLIDYGDFKLRGEMRTLDFLKAAPCP